MRELFYQDRYTAIYRDSEEKIVTSIHAQNDAVIVPLLDQDTVLLAIEPSEAFGEPTIVLPGGIIEAEEGPEEAALRELQEEIGYTAAHLDFLGELRPWSKYLAAQSFVYLARGLTPSKLEGDEAYPILIERVSLQHFEHLVVQGRLQDARVVAALALARHFLQEGKEVHTS
jgi:ADP-ribose diphosphatase